jgi:hypothetical protein
MAADILVDGIWIDFDCSLEFLLQPVDQIGLNFLPLAGGAREAPRFRFILAPPALQALGRLLPPLATGKTVVR